MKLSRKIKKARGTYVVIAGLEIEKYIRVGKIGTFCFQPGFYAYAGSAFGPGGLMSRIMHHIRISSKPHWHMDYFRREAKICEIWLCYDQKPLEHVFADTFLAMDSCSVPAKRFGSSDCKCISHLFHFAYPPDPHTFEEKLKNRCQVSVVKF